jgi:dihydroflavonol-4-reductase
MIMNEFPAYPPIFLNCVDVKDVTKAHLRAVERPEAANNRFILSQENGQPMIDLAHALNEVLQENGYKYAITRRLAPKWGIKFLSYFSKDLSSIAPMVN